MALSHIPPLLNQFTGDGPYTASREDISVEHTQFQFVLSLLKLLNHLIYKCEVALTVADEGIK